MEIIQQAKDLIEHAVKDNQFFSGGFLLGVLTALAAYLRHLPGKIWEGFKRRFTTHVIIDSREEAFMWVQIWLSHHEYGKRARRVILKVKRVNKESGDVSDLIDNGVIRASDSKNSKIKTFFTPAPGWHLLRFKKKWIYLDFSQEKVPNSGGKSTILYETLSLRFLGTDRGIIQDIVDEAQRVVHPKNESYFNVYIERWGEWRLLYSRLSRPSSTLFYAENIYEKIQNDVKEFLSSKKLYINLGIPYRRGYLLYGPSGCGKTSLITTLAAELEYDLCVARLGQKIMTGEDFTSLMSDVPKGSMVLLEDIHVVKNHYGTSGKEDIEEKMLDFQTFTNALDGAYAPEDILVFMTTNYLDQLDPILLRPGRIDIKFHIGLATKKQIEQMYLKFYPEGTGCKKFANKFNNRTISMAALQGYLLECDSEQEAILNYKKIKG